MLALAIKKEKLLPGFLFVLPLFQTILLLLVLTIIFISNYSNGYAFQFLGESQTQIPIVIMTSDDTHGRTLELLESNSYFGMQPTQVTLLKQVCLLMSQEKFQFGSKCFFFNC